MIIVIPSYQPGKALIDLVDALDGARVVVVDDGSGPDYAAIFAMVAARGAEVITHSVNHGKGAALKTGFAHVARTAPDQAVVCADSDGQHRPADITTIAAEVERGRAAIVLGSRGFTGRVPLRSRLGNAITRRVFAILTGRRLGDTQTGLRGYPPDLLAWLGDIPGERFEYEQQVLLRAVEESLPIAEVDIATVYLEANASSHFRPVRDSWAIYHALVRHAASRLGPFTTSSLAGWLVDLTAFAAITLLGVGPLVALVGARLLSATANFTLNRHWVFGGQQLPPLLGAVGRYLALATMVLGVNVIMLDGLLGLGLWAVPAKIICDLVLFAGSFGLQRRWWGRVRDLRPIAGSATSQLSETADGCSASVPPHR